MDMLAKARSLGLPVEERERHSLDESAVRLLRADSFAVPVNSRAGVLEVLVDHVPTPAQFEALERSSGHKVTVVVTTGEILERTRQRAAALRDASSTRSLRSLWLAARQADALGVIAVAGQPPALLSVAGTTPMAAQPTLTPDEIESWVADVLAGRTHAVIPDGDDVWRVTSSTAAGLPMLTMRRLPSVIRRADELGLPASATALSVLPSGLVLVAGPPGSGRSSVALALAERALAESPRPACLVTGLVERAVPARAASSWSIELGTDAPDLGQALSQAQDSGASVLVIDTAFSDDVLAHACAKAAAGMLVFAVMPGRDAITACLELRRVVGGEAAAATLAGVVTCRLLSDALDQPVSVFEVVAATPAVVAAVCENVLGIPAAVEAGGLRSGTTLELALATAHTSGRLPLETAASAALDRQRLDVALGRMRVLFHEDVSDVDAPLIDSDVSAPAPKRRSRRGR